VNGVAHTVIGVMPAGFGYPTHKTDLWIPLRLEESEADRRVQVIGRFKPDITQEAAQAELSALAAQMDGTRVETLSHPGLRVVSFRHELQIKERNLLVGLVLPVTLVLAIACVNVSNLLLANTASRLKELTARLALGASRCRLVRQLLTESAILAAAGAGIGLLVGWVGLRLAEKYLAPLLSLHPGTLALDAPLLLTALGITCVTPALFGLVPALYASRIELVPALKSGFALRPAGRGIGERLVVAEVCLAVALVGFTGVYFNITLAIVRADPRFDAQGLFVARLRDSELPGVGNTQPVAQSQEAILDRLSRLPGVSAVAATDGLAIEISEREADDAIVLERGHVREVKAHVATVFSSREFVQTWRIPIRRGRTFADADLRGRADVAMVSERAAILCWPGDDPVGKRFQYAGAHGKTTWITVIGVIGDVTGKRRIDKPAPLVYLPLNGMKTRDLAIFLRSTMDAPALDAAVRKEIGLIDENQLVENFRTMKDLLREAAQEFYAADILFSIISALALILAVLGTYSVMNCMVMQRVREIGIRMAIGAGRRDIFMFVGRHLLGLLLPGLVFGLVLGWGLNRMMIISVIGVGSADVATVFAICLILSASALAAYFVPALKAARVNPMSVLKGE
jgi:putative ABC transport system permease protein